MTRDMAHQADAPNILVLNAGSSSIKFALFDGHLNQTLSGIAEGIGEVSKLTIGTDVENTPFIDHRAALSAVLERLKTRGFDLKALAAVGHRVVHGGAKLTQPTAVFTVFETAR